MSLKVKFSYKHLLDYILTVLFIFSIISCSCRNPKKPVNTRKNNTDISQIGRLHISAHPAILIGPNKKFTLTLGLTGATRPVQLSNFVLKSTLIHPNNANDSQLNYTAVDGHLETVIHVSKPLTNFHKSSTLQPSQGPLRIEFDIVPSPTLTELTYQFELLDKTGKRINSCQITWQESPITLKEIKYDKATRELSCVVENREAKALEEITLSYTSQTNGLKLQGEDFNNGTAKQINIPTLAPGYSSISLGKLEFGTNQLAQIKFDITLAESVIASQTKNILPLDIKLIFSQLAYDPTQHALIYNIKNEGLDVAQHIKFSYHNISTAAAEQQATLNGVREQEIIISDLASNMETSAQTLSADFKGQKQATFLCKLWYANTLIVEQNIQLENEINGNMIYEALENNDFEQALKMIQQAPLDAINYAHPGNRQRKLLMKAISKDRKDIVEALIHQGVNIHTQNKQGKTALMFAAATGTKDIAELLVNHGADVDEKDQDGETALTHAALFGKLEIAAFLLDKGAHIDHKVNNGDTPLTMAINGINPSAK